jgi:hypothetical protein
MGSMPLVLLWALKNLASAARPEVTPRSGDLRGLFHGEESLMADTAYLTEMLIKIYF